MSEFRQIDTSLADGCYVTFRRIVHDDLDASPRDFLFQDEEYRQQDQARLDAWKNSEWDYVGIQAIAHVLIVRNGFGTMHQLTSAGLWGIESDSGEDYFATVYNEEKAALLADLRAIGNPIVSGDASS